MDIGETAILLALEPLGICVVAQQAAQSERGKEATKMLGEELLACGSRRSDWISLRPWAKAPTGSSALQHFR